MTVAGTELRHGGFANPVSDSQQVFRAALDALARPGSIETITVESEAPAALAPATAALLLTLLDFETPVWLQSPDPEVEAFLRFHCSCPLTRDPAAARFALLTNPAQAPAIDAFEQGSAEYPDRSATLILQVEQLVTDAGMRLSGPGIADSCQLHASPLPADFHRQALANQRRFPRGVDFFLCSGNRLAALPRTTVTES